MDRQTWLEERRAAVVAEYNADDAYVEYPNDVQRLWVRRLLADCRRGGVVLDAPCGTGRYFPLIAEADLRVVGIDQSAAMVNQAQERGIADAVHQVGLQEMSFDAEFDAVITIDAMEHVPPEDWPRVLANLHRAVRPGGSLYLTVEETGDAAVMEMYLALRSRGLPAVPGEALRRGVTGYHYYPDRDQVLAWLAGAEWRLVDEDSVPEQGWGYRHLLAQSDLEP